ncbi:hypothetical protein CJ014_05450 [Pleomorphomonas carboxyditropha]|uniref:Uncharacterized protein n=1 Tax=Pleomorphomonas carboxyditropha TaxID=2023338 RepID=A0A2G9WZT1_9HYPH|nr:hypothetical protein CJ014_05450 [Pleomorphomonas carboxyditropha]
MPVGTMSPADRLRPRAASAAAIERDGAVPDATGAVGALRQAAGKSGKIACPATRRHEGASDLVNLMIQQPLHAFPQQDRGAVARPSPSMRNIDCACPQSRPFDRGDALIYSVIYY